MSVQSNGFIVAGNDAIWGVGSTEDAAWADFKKGMAKAGINVVPERNPDTRAEETLESEYEVIAASQALIDLVASAGGNISWSKVGVVCCTNEEFEENTPNAS